MSRPRSLRLDAATVPIVFRVQVVVGNSPATDHTCTCLPAEIDNRVATVKADLFQMGYCDVEISYHPA